ncbi:D-alanyl-D-alanine carboxypeptidase [Streptomyces sp. Ag109_G2-6]|uniref:serine hydrolase n=1 Tax=Streptomyces sp. Ag109_G2-6 TaxID=2485154 RepID=UPI000FAC20E9|nr:serine hydrolase [Streptomyces sp. Ag109_G2-6]RPF29592.1 D-alanyl-D-alanine carboxypeptidase [Streptomyces sp. Ag109_G2-6]
MKAETVTGGDGTLVLTGREGADADARARAGREQGGAEPEPDTAPAPEGTPTAATPPRDADSAAPEATEPGATDTPARTARNQDDADEPDAGRGPARAQTAPGGSADGGPTTPRSEDSAAQDGQTDTDAPARRKPAPAQTPAGGADGGKADPVEPTAPQDEDSAAQEGTQQGAADALAAGGQEPADADAPAGRKPAGAKTAPGGAVEGDPAGVTEPSATARDTDSAAPKTPDPRKPRDTHTVAGAGAPAVAEPRSGSAEGDSSRPTGSVDAREQKQTPAEEDSRPAEDEITDRGTEAEPAAGNAPAEDPRAAPGDAPGRGAAAGPGATDTTPAERDASGPRADTPGPEAPEGAPATRAGATDGEGPDEHEQQGSAAGARGTRTDGTDPQADDESAAATTGAGPAKAGGAAPVRRPTWAERGDQPDEEDPRPSGRDGGAASATEDPDGTAPARRPSWAKGDDGPEEGRNTPEERAPHRPRGPGPEDRDAAGPKPAPAPAAQPSPPAPEPTREAPRPVPEPTRQAPRPALEPTRQAPRPVLEPTRETPRPALDLLAELTNTPPPPETPARTLTRRVKVWTPIVLLLGAAVAGGQMLRPLPAPQLVGAQNSVTLDGTLSIPWPAQGQGAVRLSGSGDIAAFGEQKPVPTASVAKVMTAYVILRDHPLRKDEAGPQIEIDAQAAAESNSDDESRIKHLTAGQKFSQRELLKMVMVPSANNIARLLARWDGGSGGEAAFVAKMNAAARELGMRDTTYTDPSGLNSGTVSTAVDQLKLAEAAMQDEVFRAIVTVTDEKIDGVAEPLHNSNDLLWVKGLGNKGIKTGSSTAAGGTLVWAADKAVGGETPLVIGALMDQHAPPPDPYAGKSLALVLENSRKVIEAVRKALAATPVIHKGQTVGHVSDGLGGRTPLVATKDLSVIGVPGQRLRLTLGTAGGKPVPHEAAAGTEVGVLTVGDGPGAKTVPVAVGTELAEPSFGTRVTRLS